MRYNRRRDTADHHGLPPTLTLAHRRSSEAKRTSGIPQALQQRPPESPAEVAHIESARIARRPILGGLINKYSQAA
jgi:hypothetical protein